MICTNDPRYAEHAEHVEIELQRASERYGVMSFPTVTQIIVKDPFTMVSISGYTDPPFNSLIGHGFAKRNPTDAPDIQRALSIATFRAYRDALGIEED